MTPFSLAFNFLNTFTFHNNHVRSGNLIIFLYSIMSITIKKICAGVLHDRSGYYINTIAKNGLIRAHIFTEYSDISIVVVSADFLLEM